MYVFGNARRSLSLVFFLLALPSFLGFQVSLLEQTPSPAEVEKHIRFLASDELRGRKPGTDGDHVAARYIAEHFRAHGLAPAPGFNDFFQPVPLQRVQMPERQQVWLLGTELPGEDFILVQGESCRIEGELIEIDSSRTTATNQQNDLRGMIATTTLAVLDASFLDSVRDRVKTLRERGAEAVIGFYDGTGWEGWEDFLSRARLSLASEEGYEKIPFLLVRDRDRALRSKLETPGKHTARIILSERRVEEVRTANVIGVLEGQDPRLKDEWVALTAHFDHIGEGLDLAGATPEDSIFNGARDNAMGVTALLSAATTLSASRPARSVIFIAFTAEEAGLLGSAYYVSHPAVPLEKTVFVLNADGAGYTDTSTVTVIGLGRTTAAPEIEQACRESGLEAFGGGPGLQDFFNASDNLSFAKKGVTAVLFSPGMRVFGAEIRKYYHQPSDEADENFDFAYLHRFCQAYALAADLVANRPTRPSWVPGDKYAEAAAELYGGQ
ncbi:MAG TPA: M28 family peptidase [Acidobacteriota bacterium]|nr:M28 family peptidase [Acidobacteriota bacterium]